MVLSEVRTRDDVGDQRGAWALPWAGASLLAFDIHVAGDATKRVGYKPSVLSLGMSQVPNNQGTADVLYRCSDIAGAQFDRMPCAEFVSRSDDPESETHYLSAAPRSLHSAGVSVAFLDGHCGFLPNSVDEFSMAFLICPNDGRNVDARVLAP
jgi:prepilin-type processing-associated H-X9-DG protein